MSVSTYIEVDCDAADCEEIAGPYASRAVARWDTQTSRWYRSATEDFCPAHNNANPLEYRRNYARRHWPETQYAASEFAS